jgi:dihydroorotase
MHPLYMKVLLKNATIIDAASAHHLTQQDVLVVDGLIAQVGGGIQSEADVVLESRQLHVSAGWLDLRTHATEPGYEHKETLDNLAAVAVAGGYTQVALLPNTKPTVQTKGIVQFLGQPRPGRLTDFLPIAAVTLGTEGKDFTEMLDLHAAGAVAFSDGAHPLWNADILLKTLQYLAPIDGLLMNRPEEPQLAKFGQMHEGTTSTLLGMKGIPSMAEEIAIVRDLNLLSYANVASELPRLHFSLISTARSVQLIRDAKRQGLPISCDVASHQLVFTDESLLDFDTNFKVNPPFRSANDVEALWDGLADGTIDAVVSDHTPHDEESKNLEFDLADFGIIGLETTYALLNTHRTDRLNTVALVECLTSKPRRLLRIAQPKIAVGEIANLTVFDPSLTWTYTKTHSTAQNTPLFGTALTGKVLGVFNHKQFYHAQ